MSAAREGMNLARQGQQISEKMAQGIYTGPAPADDVQGGAAAVQFPRKFTARSRYDDEMNTKMQLMDKDGMTPFGQVYYDEKVGRWLQDKEAAAEAADFDAYFGANFVKNDLASRQWAQGLHPEWFDAREEEMDERAEWVMKIKKIQLRGPQNEEDLKILYLIENGKVELPPGWDQIGPGFASKTVGRAERERNEEEFRKGLIRMPLFLTESQRQKRAGDNRAYGAWGNPETKAAFYDGQPPGVDNKQNVPLSQYKGDSDAGRTLGMNWRNFLGKPPQ